MLITYIYILTSSLSILHISQEMLEPIKLNNRPINIIILIQSVYPKDTPALSNPDHKILVYFLTRTY